MEYIVTDFSAAPPVVVTAECAVLADSPWFSGHFPGNPILPGVAQLEMVMAALARVSGKNLYVARLGRVKFKSVVCPGENLRIEARAGAETGAFTFSIHADDREVCYGNMILLEKNSEIMSEIQQTIVRVAAIIINELKLEDVTPETLDPDLDLVDEVGIDSMDLATIALSIRDEFAIRIDEDDYPKLTTVRIIAEYIRDRRQEK